MTNANSVWEDHRTSLDFNFVDQLQDCEKLFEVGAVDVNVVEGIEELLNYSNF